MPVDADAGGGEGVDQQHGDGHGADAAWDGRYGRGLFGDRLEIHVAHQPVAAPGRAIRDAVDAHVDYHRAIPDHIGRNSRRPPNCRHQYVGIAGDVAQVEGAGVADGDRGVAAAPSLHQQGRQRLAHDVAAPAYRHVGAVGVVAVAYQQFDDAGGGAGREVGAALEQLAQVVGMDAVNVLVRGDGFDYAVLVNPARQRELHQDAVNSRVFAVPIDGRKDFSFGRRAGQVNGIAEQSGLLAGSPFVGNIHRRRRVAAHQHHRQAGRHSVLLLHLDNAGRDFAAYLSRQVAPGQNLGRHRHVSQCSLCWEIVSWRVSWRCIGERLGAAVQGWPYDAGYTAEKKKAMKIEIGESLGYSYLRHVKQCWLVQANWKASVPWTNGMGDDALESAFQEMRERFDRDGRVFKGTKDSGQFLRQAEIDVVGVDQDGGVHAMEVAFHEAGLNYVGGPHIRVLKKLLRTKLVLDAYHPSDTKRDIYFVSPKVHRGVQGPLEDVFSRLQEAYPSIRWHLLTNERFASEMLAPTLKSAESVADTSELFVRSVKLLSLAENDRPSRISQPPQKLGKHRKILKNQQGSSRYTPSDKFQGIVRGLMRTLLDDQPTLLGEGRLRNLTDLAYCRDVMDLQLGGFSLLRRQEEGREISGHQRYWSRLYGGRYYVTNNWWPPHKSHNAESLVRFVRNLIEEQRDNAVIAALDPHLKNLQDYIYQGDVAVLQPPEPA